MKKMTKLALTLLAGVVISACGSGGSGSSAKPQNEKPKAEQPKAGQPKAEPKAGQPKAEPKAGQPKAEPKAGQPKAEPKAEQPKAEPKAEKPKAEQPVKPETIKVTTKDSGKVFVSVSSAKPELSKFTLTDPNLKVINVDGFAIPLSDLKVDKKESLVSYNYTGVHFGVASSEEKGHYYSFYNGKPATEIPVSGIVKYSGDVVLSTIDGYTEGNAAFNADFSKKELNGSFNFGKKFNSNLSDKFAKGLTVNATISGNSFAGTVSSAEVGSAALEGKFYGENVKQLAGAFDNASHFGENKATTSWGGAFGAVKQ
ncbi:transferrin-binding protein-like solute binding protein [Actinobacillus equuli subsp. haemolyticus]|uniref:transferrin-binding protein-like solute binding protein n=1 Tax=Actinobacillus equuli TaxID=718 RepID=UPI0024182E3A|nr:transferrin-binding protein-like solute binding protein [Actinobacillus equuli]MDG4947905.1 transferrin-binding protein-like solute binding protein [Actinobacillus equuli subsp. haemolyticus]